MFNFARAISRAASLRPAACVLKQMPISASSSVQNRLARNLWHMCSTRPDDSLLHIEKPSFSCSCGCGAKHAHSKGEQELIEFLTEEIATEKQNRKYKTIPTEVDGFKVKTDGADVTLSKKVGDETIEISLNVNHTVDTEADADINPNMDKPEFPELRSKPQFEVDIKRGEQTLSFTCSFLSEDYDASEEGYNDIFGINEVTLYKGEWSDKTYAVAGDVLDGCLYDLLMNLLEEKGISNEFAEKLIEFSTAYESSLYIDLLNNVQKFTARK